MVIALDISTRLKESAAGKSSFSVVSCMKNKMGVSDTGVHLEENANIRTMFLAGKLDSRLKECD